eukprot:10102761-Alexandrium_andersonii.AAC.1
MGAIRLSSGEWVVGVCWRSHAAFVGRSAGVCWRSRPSGSRPPAGPVGGAGWGQSWGDPLHNQGRVREYS